ncbi:MAG: hypothetical protein JNM47_13180 [Hyphomonadaceae bacterium]|nr:hypothetical protein [Hyphomonadaceae bacterium]
MRFEITPLPDGLSVKGRGAWKAVNKKIAKYARNPDNARIKSTDDIVEIRGLPADELTAIHESLADKD